MNKQRRRRTASILASFGAALIVFGCGSSSGSSATDSTPVTTNASTSAPSPTTPSTTGAASTEVDLAGLQFEVHRDPG